MRPGFMTNSDVEAEFFATEQFEIATGQKWADLDPVLRGAIVGAAARGIREAMEAIVTAFAPAKYVVIE